MSKSVIVSFTVAMAVFLSSNGHAACTYKEAVMAFNSGNLIRGQALMKMAANDGDQRAVHFLNSIELASDHNRQTLATGDASKKLNFAVKEDRVNSDADNSKPEKNS